MDLRDDQTLRARVERNGVEFQLTTHMVPTVTAFYFLHGDQLDLFNRMDPRGKAFALDNLTDFLDKLIFKEIIQKAMAERRTA